MKCVGTCKKEFVYGEWECFPGVKHEVEAKAYYCADAPSIDPADTDPERTLKASRNIIHVIPPIRTMDNGVSVLVEHPPAMFRRGQYRTNDPQMQWFLENGTAAKHLCTQERWYEVYHTEKQKLFDRGVRINEKLKGYEAQQAEVNRKEKEVNELLASLKEKAKKEKTSDVIGVSANR